MTREIPNAEIAREAAMLLRRLLEAVERGELTAGTPRSVALIRRIEGAAAALDAVGKQQAREERQ
jgi:hypothetical protein